MSSNLPRKYQPKKLRDVRGQSKIVKPLQAFARNPERGAFVFCGGTGSGKSSMAHCLAAELGVAVEEKEFGGLLEIPSGEQDGKAVQDLGRSLQLIPFMGSGWRFAIINEADRMTPAAETVWLDLLENLPPRSVICFTTNDVSKLSDRLLHRCEVYSFEDSAAKLRSHIVKLAKHVWKLETGKGLKTVPEELGVYDRFSGTASFRLALQQLAVLIRSGSRVPKKLDVPLMRTENPHREAARKAVATRKRNAEARALSQNN